MAHEKQTSPGPLSTGSDGTKITGSSKESTVGATSNTLADQKNIMDQTEIPLRPQTTQLPSQDDIVRRLRGFYLGNPEIPKPEDSVDGRYLPAFLTPYRDGSALRHDYPLFLVSPMATSANDTLTDSPFGISWPSVKWIDSSPQENPDPIADSHTLDAQPTQSGIFPLPGLFHNLMADSITDSRKRLLKENLIRLEKHIVEIFNQGGQALRSADKVLDQAIQALLTSLRLGEKQHGQLVGELQKLKEKMPEGHFLGFSPRAPLHILAHMAKLRFRTQREKILRQVDYLASGLRILLEMEKSKSIEAIEPKMLLNSIGFGGDRFLDPLSLSDLMDHTYGSQTMPAERLERIKEILQVLENERAIGIGTPGLTLVISTSTQGIYGWKGSGPPPDFFESWERRESLNPFATAMTVFDEQVEGLIRMVRAMRIAVLELENNYDPKIHDSWFRDFDWRALSEEEAKLSPVVVVADSAANVARNGFIGLSRLLRTDRPVQVVLEVHPGVDPAAEGEDIIPTGSRTELGYFGISYRHTAVSQSSSTRPMHLLESFAMALQSKRPALHMLGSGYLENSQRLPSPWLLESAAVESRAHPLFQYDPNFGGRWWVPLSLADNPQSDTDWPVHPFQYRTEDGATTEIHMTFGFADYALLEPRLWRHFYPVPETLDAKELIHLDDYLASSSAEMHNRLPFIWAVHDDHGTRGARLRRLIVSATLVEACLDRREFWRTLQALSGVRNHHVDASVREIDTKAKEQIEAQRALLVTEHHLELEKARQEAGAEALQRLTEAILSMDLSSVGLSTAPSAHRNEALDSSSPVQEQATTEEQSKEAAKDATQADTAEASDSGSEPWIDTPLCTTCNECTDINPRLFVYDDNKQAEIGDLSAGTHEDWVKAAEVCPAQCIYPGDDGT